MAEPKPCLKRLETGGWCVLPDGHDAGWPCLGYPTRKPTDAAQQNVLRQKGKP